jgi:uncharacterized protein (UPF0548 family)
VSFHIRRPSDSRIARCLGDGAGAAFTYASVGATRGGRSALPPSVTRAYDVDHYERELGSGLALFARARAALLEWRSFGIGWLELHGAASAVQPDHVVATLVRTAGLWALCPCRVVYVIDDWDEPGCASSRNTAFAYGTLPGHPESGEECFLVTWEPETDVVRYEILAFSRPAQAVARIGYPAARRLQKRFGASSLAALAHAAG